MHADVSKVQVGVANGSWKENWKHQRIEKKAKVWRDWEHLKAKIGTLENNWFVAGRFWKGNFRNR